jgi:two-component system alkaline phosphatase synthesis response regulator PhoP
LFEYNQGWWLSTIPVESEVSKAKILVVDDEQAILDLVTAYLDKEGFEFHTAIDGPAGLKAVRVFKPDIVVLDIMLPEMDGLEVLGQLRRESDVYVIMLTAKSEETDKIIGLSLGADDYLTKPFSPRELVARIKAALRRMREGPSRPAGSIITSRRLRLDISGRQAWMEDQLVELTAIEFDLLRVLAENPGIVLSREQILERVWGHDYYGEIRVVDVHVGHIRQKLGAEDILATVRGVGYRFEDYPV